jgi:DedD protein
VVHASIGRRRWSDLALEDLEPLQHAVGFEPLRDEKTIEPLELPVVGDGGPAPQPAVERRLHQRFVVQVGAFADAEAARESRKNVEKLGLKTYTQVAQTASGNRIRVRVGPFATRAEAEAALAKAKAAGLNAVLLTL